MSTEDPAAQIVRVLRIAHIHTPGGRKSRAHTCGARWQYAIEHINANTYCLDERGGVAHSHQVARFVLGKALRNRTKVSNMTSCSSPTE